MPGHHCRDDLGIGGDRAGDVQAVVHFDVGVIVDIAVEHGDHVGGAARLLELFTVERVTIGFADDPDACPPCMPEHGHARVGLRQREPQQRVCCKGRAQGAGVVAEFADFLGRLVHETEALASDAHRTVLEQWICVAFGEHSSYDRVGNRQSVVPYEQVQAGGVATTHLEAIERRQRLLHGQITGDRCDGAVAADQRLDLAGGA